MYIHITLTKEMDNVSGGRLTMAILCFTGAAYSLYQRQRVHDSRKKFTLGLLACGAVGIGAHSLVHALILVPAKRRKVIGRHDDES